MGELIPGNWDPGKPRARHFPWQPTSEEKEIIIKEMEVNRDHDVAAWREFRSKLAAGDFDTEVLVHGERYTVLDRSRIDQFLVGEGY